MPKKNTEIIPIIPEETVENANTAMEEMAEEKTNESATVDDAITVADDTEVSEDSKQGNVSESENNEVFEQAKAQSRRDVLAQKRENEEKRAKANLKREQNLMGWEQLKSAKHENTVLNGEIVAIEVLNESVVVAVVKINGFRVIIPCEEMYVESPVDMSTVTNKDRLIRREKQMLTKLLGAEIPYVIHEISGDANGEYAILGSRKRAIQKIAARNFNKHNGYARINEGDIVEATIISVGNHAVWANVQGIDTSIPIFRLTHRYVGNASEAYAPGMKKNVVIKEINYDESGKCVSIAVSGKDAEIPEFLPNLSEVSSGMNVLGTITSIRKSRQPHGQTIITLFLDKLEVPAMAMYTKIDTLTNPPMTGDKVVFSVYKTDEERGLCIGTIIRRR